jgi:multidrug efflux pump subunit AcrA (membrane-fusion protein)
LTIVAGVLLAALILCIPFPYHVSCSATIEPPVRSYLEAPFDGSLAKSLVNPGDRVEVGQILAQLDDRQTQLDLAAGVAAVEEATKRLQAARAGQDGSAALLAELDLKQARVKLQTLRERERRLLITSPIDGLVIRGDLRRVEGSPVKQGQTLFEVAAAGEMLAELEVPEAEIAYVREAMPVTIHLNALSESLRGTVRRIHPRAQLKNEASIFLIEVELDEASKAAAQLRPGMHGTASITADSYPLGWNLLHRPWQSLRRAWEG